MDFQTPVKKEHVCQTFVRDLMDFSQHLGIKQIWFSKPSTFKEF